MNGKHRIRRIYSLAKRMEALLSPLVTDLPDDWNLKYPDEKEKLFAQFLKKYGLYMENIYSLAGSIQCVIDSLEIFGFLKEELVGGWSISDIRDFFPYMSQENVSALFVHLKTSHGDSSKRLSFKSFSKIMWEGVEQIYKKQKNEL